MLVDHLTDTGELASAFADAFGSAAAAGLVGRLHDVGKADPAWQDYLRKAADGIQASTVDHKFAGARLLESWRLSTLAPVILGHHGGLHDAARASALVREAPTQGQAIAMAWASEVGVANLPERESVVPRRVLPTSAYDSDGRRRLEFWLRMLFSTLIDADRLDTQHHFDPARPVNLGGEDLGELRRRYVEGRMRSIGVRSGDPVADERSRMYTEVLAQADASLGWFEMTAPTGSGKTLATLGFALEHARVHGLRRIVAAVPFISVTEQVADSWRTALGDEAQVAVLEHHSGPSGRSEAQTGAGLRSRLAVENWDASVIVTTTVQLLESLFENHTSRVRKLHRLARSVIVLDEVQSMPWRLVEPTLDVLRELVRNYGCSVILSTATQPPFDMVGDLAGIERRNLVGAEWFQTFRRVEAVVEPDVLDWSEFADKVASASSMNDDQCLVVLNTIADARELARELSGRPGLVHLSTRMCAQHRRDVLQRVRAQLTAGEPCLLVSTQLVEAGVDVDFPVAFRAFGPLPAIAQVAGRVNRHGRRSLGVLHLVDPMGGHVPPDEYRIGTDIARDILRSGADPLDPAVLVTYFDRFLHVTRSRLDLEGIQRERELHNFATVARLYRVIVDDTTSVLVPYGRFDPQELRLPAAPDDRRKRLRQMQRFMVGLRERDFDRASERGLVHDLGGEVFAWLGSYDDLWGLETDGTTEALIW